MTFNVHTKCKYIVHVYYLICSTELIDIVRFSIYFQPSSNSQTIEKTGQYGVGTLTISYTVYCSRSTDYCGDCCQQLNSNQSNNRYYIIIMYKNTCRFHFFCCMFTNSSQFLTNTVGLYAVSALLAICFVALVGFIISLFFLAVVLLQKKTQALKKFGMMKNSRLLYFFDTRYNFY